MRMVKPRKDVMLKLSEDETMRRLVEHFGDYSWELNTPSGRSPGP